VFAASSHRYRATRGTAGSETVTVDDLCEPCDLCVEKLRELRWLCVLRPLCVSRRDVVVHQRPEALGELVVGAA
jgi:hypothetical protein